MTNLKPLALDKDAGLVLYDKMRTGYLKTKKSKEFPEMTAENERYIHENIKKLAPNLRENHFAWVLFTSGNNQSVWKRKPCFGNLDASFLDNPQTVALYVQMNYRGREKAEADGLFLHRYLFLSAHQNALYEESIRFFLNPDVSPYHPILPYVEVIETEHNGRTVVEGLLLKDCNQSRAMFVNLCIACRMAFTHPSILGSVETLLEHTDATLLEAILAGELLHFPTEVSFNVEKKRKHMQEGTSYLFHASYHQATINSRVFTANLPNQAPAITHGIVDFKGWLTGIPSGFIPSHFMISVPTNRMWNTSNKDTETNHSLNKDYKDFFNLHEARAVGGILFLEKSKDVYRGNHIPLQAFRYHPAPPTTAGKEAWQGYCGKIKKDPWGYSNYVQYESHKDAELDGTSKLWGQNVINRIREIAHGMKPTHDFGKEFSKDIYKTKPAALSEAA